MKDKKSYAFYWVVTLPMTSLTYPQRPEITHILTFWAFFQNHSLLSGVIVVRACVHQRSYSGDDEAKPGAGRYVGAAVRSPVSLGAGAGWGAA